MNIKINNIDYPCKLTFKASRLLAEKWGLPGVQAVFTEIENKLSDQAIDSAADLVLAIVQGSDIPEAARVTYDQAGQWIFDNMGKIKEIGTALASSFPQPGDDVGKQEAPKAISAQQNP